MPVLCQVPTGPSYAGRLSTTEGVTDEGIGTVTVMADNIFSTVFSRRAGREATVWPSILSFSFLCISRVRSYSIRMLESYVGSILSGETGYKIFLVVLKI